ncbi:MAG: zinc ABC transporter substrate-binding protein [Bdellovibrionota bacterium]
MKLLFYLLLATIGSSCTKAPIKREKLYIVSTTTLMKDLVDTIWADKVESASLMGPGVDPHLYQPTAKDLSKLEEADVIVAHGLHLEGKMVEALESLAKKKRVVIIGHVLDSKKLIDHGGAIDPHTWFDPALWIESAKILANAEGLPPFDPKNFLDFSKKVEELSVKYKKIFQSIPKEQRILITSHDAFHYLGRFFDIDVQGVQGVSTDSEVGVKRIDDLIQLIKKKKIKSIFSETSVSARAINKLLSESGAQLGGVLYSDALGAIGSGSDTYLGMLEHNLKTIYEGLK